MPREVIDCARLLEQGWRPNVGKLADLASFVKTAVARKGGRRTLEQNERLCER
jgi:hypothetical protein